MIVIDDYENGVIFAGIGKADLETKSALSEKMKEYVTNFNEHDKDERMHCESEDFYIFHMQPVDLIHYMGSRDALNFITGV